VNLLIYDVLEENLLILVKNDDFYFSVKSRCVQVYPVLFRYFLTTMRLEYNLFERYHRQVQLETTTTQPNFLYEVPPFI